MSARRILPALIGPTASGKTDLAVQAAELSGLPVEIVSLDSRQLYRQLDVATGKPDPCQQERITHHLIDRIDPDQSFDAGRYRREVEELLPRLWETGKIPLFVGGAGFYLRALTEGFHQIGGDPQELAAVRSELEDRSLEELRRELQEEDPQKAEGLHPNDRYRIQRALEILRLTGEKPSVLERSFQPDPILDTDIRCIHLSPERAYLHERIHQRTQIWMAGGWVEEVEGVLDRGFDPRCPGLSILGYREVVGLLQGKQSRESCLEATIVSTRQYARQQEIWFRKVEAEWRGDAADPLALNALLGLLKNVAALDSNGRHC